MKNLLFIFLLLTNLSVYSQVNIQDSIKSQIDTTIQKKSFGEKLGKFLGIDKEEEIKNLIETVGYQQMMIDSLSDQILSPSVVVKTVQVQVPTINEEQTKSIRKDEKFLKSLPKSYDNISKNDAKKLAKEIDDKINELIRQRDSLVKSKSSEELIRSKDNMINSLEREKDVISLSETKAELNEENADLIKKKDILKKYLISSLVILFVLILIMAVILQRKKIKVQDVEIEKQLEDINKKNTYLEHAARIIRHDMHSGINTYIPRGINSLEKRLNADEIKNLKIDSSVKMIKEGLNHTQKVYKSVYEFTNLVKQNVVLEKSEVELKELLKKSIQSTSYSNQVEISELVSASVNETLFWNAVDNIIKNGLKYNKSESKLVKIYMEENYLVIEDNGVGLSQSKFQKVLKSNKSDEDSGLGLNICNAILKEHGFELSCEEIKTGTKIKIKLK